MVLLEYCDKARASRQWWCTDTEQVHEQPYVPPYLESMPTEALYSCTSPTHMLAACNTTATPSCAQLLCTLHVSVHTRHPVHNRHLHLQQFRDAERNNTQRIFQLRIFNRTRTSAWKARPCCDTPHWTLSPHTPPRLHNTALLKPLSSSCQVADLQEPAS